MIVACAAAFDAGCSVKTCTDIGCVDGFSASVQRADGTFPSGTHRIEILADGVTTTCSFAFAETSPGIGRATPVCPNGLTVTVGNEETCTEMHVGNSVSFRCDPIAGRFIERVTVFGRPAQVHVWQYVDDAAILDAAAAPTYAESRPNGPECEPVCRQASASFTMQ